MTYRIMHPQFGETFQYAPDVPLDIQESLWNYLAYGVSPGGFLTAVLCNDFMNAVCRADFSWTGKSLQQLAKWILNYAPMDSWGSAGAMINWMKKDDIERRDIMIELRLRPSEFDILRGVAVA